MKYLFILGRNPEISIAEIRSYFKDQIRDFSSKGNAMLVSTDSKIPSEAIKNLGGVIAIGEIMASGTFEEVKRTLDSKEIYLGSKNNINYAVWDFSGNDFCGDILDFLKEKFKSEKLRATRKNLTGLLDLQSGEKIRIANSMLDEEFFVFSGSDSNFFGRITSKTNYREIEERDMKKPVRREELAISPRLAKIMINLSEAKPMDVLVDPFCGIGVILQEALLRGIKVIGIDKDSRAIEGARENLEWKKLGKNDFVLINSDSSKAKISTADVLVTEPELGEVLKKIPDKEKADEILRGFEKLMVSVLNNLKSLIAGRIVFTAPYIKLFNKKRKGCDIGKIISETGLNLEEGFPIPEFRENQIVGRQIFVLEK